MRALVVADLHLDMWSIDFAHPLDRLAPREWAGLDLVILAGDLTNKGHERWGRTLAWFGERVDLAKVYVLPGNHDFYGGALDLEDRLRAQAEAVGARWAQLAEVVRPGRRFLCCTLWTDMALGGRPDVNAWHAEQMMNDYRLIRMAGQGYRRPRAADTVALHHEHRRWLAGRLAAPFDGDTVVVTHHAPHPACNGAALADSAVAAAYASDLTALMEEHRPALWLHGHTHVPSDFAVGSTRVLNVSIGYPPGLDPGRPLGDPRAGLLEW
jgi:3',5'-cyclic AMP phosphodiesterase CpdA